MVIDGQTMCYSPLLEAREFGLVSCVYDVVVEAGVEDEVEGVGVPR